MKCRSRNACFGLLALGLLVLGATPPAQAQYALTPIEDIVSELSPPLPLTLAVFSLNGISDNESIAAQVLDFSSFTFKNLVVKGTSWYTFSPPGINGINASGAT